MKKQLEITSLYLFDPNRLNLKTLAEIHASKAKGLTIVPICDMRFYKVNIEINLN